MRQGQRGDPGRGTPSYPQLWTCSSSVQLLGGREEGNQDFWSQRRVGEVGGSRRKLGWGCGDWEAGPAAHRIVRNIAQAPSPALTSPPAQRAPRSAGGSWGLGEDTGAHS